ncbi:hypothetical protein [Bacteroides sp. UBA939]|uniref:hypothetical protein n=1 Tax=Bacteroides sp. UBA939 TaxID=1946092 RepID=UPI0025C30279|nr:hypothetical protein [Bacteroides sp. UBA939]
MKNNILSLSDGVIGSIFRELYSEYEKNLRNMFNDSTTEISITPRQVVEVLHRRGLSEYATQIYIAFYGFYLGFQHKSSKEVYSEVNGLIAAYRMADELGTDVSEINPQKALEYYQNCNCKEFSK